MKKRIKVGVLLADPNLPYSFSHEGKLGEEEFVAFRELKATLGEIEGAEYTFSYFNDHTRLIDDLRGSDMDLALNFCDTGYRNDWNLVSNIPSLLELFNIPYVGSRGMTIDLAADKSLTRALALTMDIPVPDEQHVNLLANPLPLPAQYPVLIKPNIGAGSYGMTRNCVANNAAEAKEYMHWLSTRIDPPEVVVQEFLSGTEYTVGVIGNYRGDLTVLHPAEIDFSQLSADLPPVFIYEAKFDQHSPYWDKVKHVPAKLSEKQLADIASQCKRLYRRLGIGDYARFDYRAGKDGKPLLLDINPNPTWYADSRMAMMAKWSGYSYKDLLLMLLDSAVERNQLGNS